jgi:hypothetical protein
VSDFLSVLAVAADILTVIAAAIAIAGVVWAVLGVARLDVTHFSHPSVSPSLTFAISSVGSNPIRDLQLNFGTLLDNGFSMMGGDFGMKTTLGRGESLLVQGYEAGEIHFGSPPREGEYRLEVPEGEGWFLQLQWQSPLFPWRRSSRTYAWPPSLRYAAAAPEVLSGRREIAFFKRTRNPELNPLTPGYVAPPDLVPRAVVATDATFDALLADHKGPVLVGFGPTWQGKWWQDTKRVLGALAGKHAPKLRVLTVDIDHCPALAERFHTNEVPVFKVLVAGQVAKSYTGSHSLRDLEKAFAEFFR